MASLVDWEFAKTTGAALASPGPRVTLDEAAAEVSALRAAAASAHLPVAETSQLDTPPDSPRAVIVDRPTWIGANADSMAALLGPAIDAVTAKRGQPPSPTVAAVGAKVTGAEAGALLAFMAGKVLGQYDLAPEGVPQLLLVAPNIVQVQRELEVDAADFRAWVCMHEETHRVQFTANPWLRDHLIDRARTLAADLTPDPEALPELAAALARRIPEAFREDGLGLTDVFATPEQREQLAALTAVMSLLEGHADVVMDDVGPAHIPSVAEIRAKFTQRRRGTGVVDRLLRRLLGLEAKMRQYRDGAAFVRGVHERVGVSGFNAIWDSPQTLPVPQEIADPSAWVRRVHG